jgi:hypothetical protein
MHEFGLKSLILLNNSYPTQINKHSLFLLNEFEHIIMFKIFKLVNLLAKPHGNMLQIKREL